MTGEAVNIKSTGGNEYSEDESLVKEKLGATRLPRTMTPVVLIPKPESEEGMTGLTSPRTARRSGGGSGKVSSRGDDGDEQARADVLLRP